MTIYHGNPALEKIAVGRIWIYKKFGYTPCREEIESVEEEIARFDAAREDALDELDALTGEAALRVGDEEAEVFTAHRMLVRDPMFYDFVCEVIRRQRVNAEFAVARAQDHFVRMLLGVDDERMRERAADVADVSERLLKLLDVDGRLGTGDEGLFGFDPEEPLILAAEELTPSETLGLDRERICAILLERGAANSHAAILARSMDIPVFLNVDIQEDWAGKLAVADGISGEIILDPDEECLERMRAAQREIDEREEALEALRRQDAVTRGGRKIGLYANIAKGADVDAAIENGAGGIGLFRSEFLYLQSADWPSEEEQFAAYRAVVKKMQGKSVVIRTLDAGADKRLPYMQMSDGSDPGSRGIRVCLDRPEMFRTQLRAILRAAACGNVSVMFPMIRSAEELTECREHLAAARDELERRGELFGDVKVGIMIETPEAVEHGAELARAADFFSIGTNDLIPALLGLDRFGPEGDARGEKAAPALHPLVAEAVSRTVEAAHAEGITVGICGELASDTEMTGILVSKGIDYLSVAPAALLPVKEAVRGLD